MSKLTKKMKTKRKPVLTLKREDACYRSERDCVKFYLSRPNCIPDGSFMRSMFRKGYDAALRDMRKKETEDGN